MLRCEIARLFGGFPHELLRLPVSEYRMLENYYWATKEAERAAREEVERSGFSGDQGEGDE